VLRVKAISSHVDRKVNLPYLGAVVPPIDPITDQTGVLFMLFGTLSTSFGMVVGYFFGSSKGSADKSMELANIAAKKQ